MTDINKQIGDDLKKLREAHKYSLEDVANIVGKSRKTIHAYEKGSIEISVTNLTKILNIYGIRVGKFLDDISK